MYAIIETGSKQFRVEKDTVLTIEKLDVEKGKTVSFDRVLLTGDGDKVTIGTPLVSGVKVTAEIVDQFKGEKVIAFKKRRRHGYQRTHGHRQNLTKVKITGIQL
jgi:large subunit ribosomal protein L21